MIGLYAIIHVPTRRAYIGSSVNIRKRFSTHRSMLKNSYHHAQYLQNAWNKYGEEQFEFKQIATCKDHNEAIKLEQAFLECFYGDGLFNSKNDACGVGSGIKHPNKSKPLSDEQKQKISVALTGKKKTKEHAEKVAAKSRGIKRSAETKERVRVASTKYIVYTPEGKFFGLKEAGKFYNVKGDTIKAWCHKKPDWHYESI